MVTPSEKMLQALVYLQGTSLVTAESPICNKGNQGVLSISYSADLEITKVENFSKVTFSHIVMLFCLNSNFSCFLLILNGIHFSINFLVVASSFLENVL